MFWCLYWCDNVIIDVIILYTAWHWKTAFFGDMATINLAFDLCFFDGKTQSKNHQIQGLDCRIDVVKPSLFLLILTGTGINFVHKRVITEHFDPPITGGLWLVIEHFYGLKPILAANSLHSIQQGHICVLERKFRPLDTYCWKTTP